MSLRAGALASAAAVLAGALAACGASAQGTSATAAPSQSQSPLASVAKGPIGPPSLQGVAGTQCGPRAQEVLARAAGLVATRIYSGELTGSETLSDKRQVEGFTPLLSALASGEGAAVKAAVTSLVFSHTHVVRLRVSRGGTVLADIGGPYILAPVSGNLRFHGRTVGHYTLSVQDDLGYVKLATRFIGAPLTLRTGSHTVPVEGVLTPGPASIPAHGPVSYRNASYEAFSFDANAFPSGPLRISLLMPVPRSLSANTCAQIKTAELGSVAQRISRRFTLSPASFAPYIKLTRTLTDALTYIRSGSRQLAGSTRPGPQRLPNTGTVKYHGLSYGVSSFSAPTTAGQVRVYVLVAQ